ncbi:NAD(P)/FAD-dependent oxidoreductase [Lacticaseibacillus camelliae]|uniref:NADH:ubiquinone reductase (non-electrogenic) n=1 Tax=Lacticaseibacillus camelliae DSM 22697 = JCM 13995 TaxID=1423730 RepID=A0A0R2FEF5_9LACO|nr:NAD(P)/FAD-dependent oxidoreductase [Lacticaseibacillus camelliae]KRN22980.1 NADH dehydrogenase, FAD-containing subunit [Lacticaseibacillus camelliae DSM 22697 = JCM 13995]
MAQKNIVIVGAGFAGVYATKRLAKHFKKDKDVTITLIDRHSYFTYMTELHEVAADRVPEDAIQYDLQRLFARRKNVKLVTDTATTIDREKKLVKTKHGAYPYDYVMLGIGSQPNDFGTPGVKDYGFTLGSWEHAIALKKHIQDVVRRGAEEHDPAKRKALLSIVVVGSGFTGTETIGELRDWRDSLAKENKLDPSEITFTLMEMAPTIMNMLDRSDANKAERYLLKKGVKVMKNTGVVGVHEDHVDLKDGSTYPTSTLIWTAGVKATDEAAKFGLTQARAGRIVVNSHMESQDDPDVYVVGDVSFFGGNSDRGEPQIVQGAEASAKTALTNIENKMAGKPGDVDYKASYSGFMVSLGSRYGVANLMNIFHLSGFFAMLMKHLVNMLYFLQNYSGYYFFQYLMHEFFRTKNDRNLMRGHTSRQGNVLWAVPARIFLGLMWLVDCAGKVSGKESWFLDKLRLPFDWLQPATTSGASAAGADATSAASGAAKAAAPAAKTVFSLSYQYGKEPMMVFDKMPNWMYTITKAMIPNQNVAFFMQKSMTIIEILIGLALVAGLFTWLSGAVSVAFTVIFCLSGMFYWVNIWMIPMAIAVMNGSGRAFGLDKWVVPYLQKTFGKWWYGTPKALYGSDTPK